MIAKSYVDFITITCLNWRPLLASDRFKDIITSSLSFLSKDQRVVIYAFVIMPTHLHMVWQMIGDHKRENVQRDFLKFTSQQMLKLLRNARSPIQDEILVKAKDRKYQVWQRNALSVPLWSYKVMWQKVGYIHFNPVKAGLCARPEDYKYSSASFYYHGDRHWDFLVRIDG